MKLLISNDAREDMLDSFIYGYQNFGEAQAMRYEELILTVFELLVENPRMGAERLDLTPPVRMHHHGRHMIIYTLTAEAVVILRVLGDGMDVERHLKT